MLRENNNSINYENYIGLPYQGGIRYVREDLLDDLPDQEFNALMMNAVPYEGMMADNHKRRFERRSERKSRKDEKRQFKLDKKQARTDRRKQKQDSRLARVQARKDAKLSKVEARQGAKTDRSGIRAETREGFIDTVGSTVGDLIQGDQTGGTISFGPGQGITAEGQIGVGSEKNFFTNDNIIKGVPNYILLGAGGLGLFLLLRK